MDKRFRVRVRVDKRVRVRVRSDKRFRVRVVVDKRLREGWSTREGCDVSCYESCCEDFNPTRAMEGGREVLSHAVGLAMEGGRDVLSHAVGLAMEGGMCCVMLWDSPCESRRRRIECSSLRCRRLQASQSSIRRSGTPTSR